MATKSEILMKVETSPKQAIAAECNAMLDPADSLMSDFTAGKFFQIEDFSFSAGLEDHEAKAKTQTGDRGKSQQGDSNKEKAKSAKFSKWRGASGLQTGLIYPLEVEPISFSRFMDRASTVLLQGCCNSTTFSAATIVRRMAVGPQSIARAYLRLDFTNILFTSVDWDEDEIVKEKYKFICRGARVQFRAQGSDGSLSAPVPGVWPKTA